MASILRSRAIPVARSFAAARAGPNFTRIVARKYSTETSGPGESAQPPKSGNSSIFAWVGVGALVVGGTYFALSSNDKAATTAKSTVQSAKVAANFVPSKADYQKVCSLSNFR